MATEQKRREKKASQSARELAKQILAEGNGRSEDEVLLARSLLAALRENKQLKTRQRGEDAQ
jgi:hypothetical protein